MSSVIWNWEVSTNYKREILWIINSFEKLLSLCFLIRKSLPKKLRLLKVIKFLHKMLKMQNFSILFSPNQLKSSRFQCLKRSILLLKKYLIWYWKQFSNIWHLNIQVSLLSIMLRMGECFNFYVFQVWCI